MAKTKSKYVYFFGNGRAEARRAGARGDGPQGLDHQVCQSQDELRLHHAPRQDLVPAVCHGLGGRTNVVAKVHVSQ